jgi:hypothetical protein
MACPPGLRPPAGALEVDDVVLARIAAGVHLDALQRQSRAAQTLGSSPARRFALYATPRILAVCRPPNSSL